MKELCRSNDMVLLSFIEALLREARIQFLVADAHMSILEGSLGVLPRRILVEEADWYRAVRVLCEGGVSAEIATDAE